MLIMTQKIKKKGNRKFKKKNQRGQRELEK